MKIGGKRQPCAGLAGRLLFLLRFAGKSQHLAECLTHLRNFLARHANNDRKTRECAEENYKPFGFCESAIIFSWIRNMIKSNTRAINLKSFAHPFVYVGLWLCAWWNRVLSTAWCDVMLQSTGKILSKVAVTWYAAMSGWLTSGQLLKPHTNKQGALFLLLHGQLSQENAASVGHWGSMQLIDETDFES